MVYCRHCGDQIPVDSVFCPSCGKNLLPEDPNPDMMAPVESAEPETPVTRRDWLRGVRNIPWQRYRMAASGVIHLNNIRQVRVTWTVSQVLFTASAAFSVVGFVLSLAGRQQGLSWILFGLVLGLGALYTKDPPTRGTPPTLGG